MCPDPRGLGSPPRRVTEPAGSHGAALETHMYRWTRGALLGAVAIVLGSATALAATSDPASLGAPPSSLALSRVDLSRAAAAADLPVSPVLLATAPAPEPVQFGAVRYQPEQQQQQYDNPANDRPIVSQLHGGYFDASANNTNPFIVGLRAGPMIDKRLQVGLMLDWVHQTKNLANVLSTTEGPGSITVKTQQDTARALLNLVPIMAFAQASGFGLLGLVPYVGAAGGYEVLVLSADNFLNGNSFEANFGGWGYQVYAGCGLPLGGRTRLNGELFVNQATLSKTITDANGVTAKQVVDLNGIGFRLGLAWGYQPRNSN